MNLNPNDSQDLQSVTANKPPINKPPINKPPINKPPIFDKLFPNDLPRGLFVALIMACLLLGLAALRHRQDAWLAVLEQWLFMLIIIPTATAVITLPHKYREPSFDVKKAYYLGMFVAFLFTLAKLRYWR